MSINLALSDFVETKNSLESNGDSWEIKNWPQTHTQTQEHIQYIQKWQRPWKGEDQDRGPMQKSVQTRSLAFCLPEFYSGQIPCILPSSCRGSAKRQFCPDSGHWAERRDILHHNFLMSWHNHNLSCWTHHDVVTGVQWMLALSPLTAWMWIQLVMCDKAASFKLTLSPFAW